MNNSLTRNIFGLAILVIGIGFLLDNLNLLDFGSLFSSWWPLLVVFGGLAALVSNWRQPIFPLLIVAAGVLLQLRALEVIQFNVFSLFWPAIIIGVGLSILLNRSNSLKTRASKDETNDLFAFLSGISAKNKAGNYRGGKVTAVMGGVELDLRQASIKDTAEIDIFTFWGGAELKVPKDWRVNVSGMPVLGGWEDKTDKPDSKKAPVLNINATCVMGGVEIKN